MAFGAFARFDKNRNHYLQGIEIESWPFHQWIFHLLGGIYSPYHLLGEPETTIDFKELSGGVGDGTFRLSKPKSGDVPLYLNVHAFIKSKKTRAADEVGKDDL